MTGEDIVAEARTWLGTPFHHQARVKGHGVDCIGLVVGVAKALGFSVRDRSDYSRMPDGASLIAEMTVQFRQVDREAMQSGDILVFAMPRLPRHVAIYLGGGRMAHATSTVGKCVEVNFDAPWQRALRAVFRFPEVAG